SVIGHGGMLSSPSSENNVSNTGQIHGSLVTVTPETAPATTSAAVARRDPDTALASPICALQRSAMNCAPRLGSAWGACSAASTTRPPVECDTMTKLGVPKLSRFVPEGFL